MGEREMPLYFYLCNQCRKEFELQLEDPLDKAVCPNCQAPDAVRRSYLDAYCRMDEKAPGEGT
jgi:putative FmdB family regulatory protein